MTAYLFRAVSPDTLVLLLLLLLAALACPPRSSFLHGAAILAHNEMIA